MKNILSVWVGTLVVLVAGMQESTSRFSGQILVRSGTAT